MAAIGAVSKANLVPLLVNKTLLHLNPDTGADITLIDTTELKKFQPRPKLRGTDIKVLVYGAKTDEPLEILGAFKAELVAGDKKIDEVVYVSRRLNRGVPLLSRDASKKLGIVTINIPAEPNVNVSPILKVPPEGSKDHPLCKEFNNIFDGIGKHKDLSIKLSLQEGAKPYVAPPSKVPLNLYAKVKAELDHLLEMDIIERVPPDDNTQFISRLVPVPKRVEGSTEIGVRLTIDLRELNKFLDPVHHYVPTVEETKFFLNGAGEFSDLDMRQAFFQLSLDEDSCRLTTFNTPWGLMRFKRLVQGAKPSSSICHEVIRHALQGIKSALNIADNVIVWGCGNTPEEIREDHDRALREVFERFRHLGLTLHRKKCTFRAKRIKFFGFIFTNEGVQPDPEKVAALRNADPPKSKEEVRSFMGMATFNSAYIPQFSTISEPLRHLMRKDTRFVWGKKEQDAFKTITQAICETALLSYYDPKKDTAIFTDAGPTGVNATLAQLDENGKYRPINIASRSLTETEQNYDQLEREAVAMHFGCLRFKPFLEGIKFKHFIDPEPLKAMMEKTRKEAPARVDRVRLKLQGFSNEIHIVKGSENPADYLSRHPLPYKLCSKLEKRDFKDIENHLFIVASMLPDAITIPRVQEATSMDPVLSEVISTLKAGTKYPCKPRTDMLPFKSIWSSLSVAEGVLLRGDRIVLPKSLVQDALRIAHEGHMGIEKSKKYLRNSVWFPRMDSLMEDEIRKCLPCSAVTPVSRRDPVVMTPLPPEPWQLIAADIFGPLPSGEKVLVMKCLRSKWPEIKVLTKSQGADSEAVISAMERTFATLGIPETIQSDNGPPFNGRRYQEFAKYAGFKVKKVTPLWPEANGSAENFMKCLGKVVRTAHIEGRDWKRALDEFLLVFRATPHPSTGETPAAVMFPGKPFKTRLPLPPAKVKQDSVKEFNDNVMGRAKAYADERHRAKPHDFNVGDTVLVRQRKVNKLTPYYSPNPYIIEAIKGTMITAHRNGQKITRNSSHFRRIPPRPPIAQKPAKRLEKTRTDPGTIAPLPPSFPSLKTVPVQTLPGETAPPAQGQTPADPAAPPNEPAPDPVVPERLVPEPLPGPSGRGAGVGEEIQKPKHSFMFPNKDKQLEQKAFSLPANIKKTKIPIPKKGSGNYSLRNTQNKK